MKCYNDCWLWARNLNRQGYGVWTTLINGKRKLAHRVMYELAYGEVPSGLELDHLCRVTTCVNPDHLEPVTQKENMLRGFSPAALNARKSRCKYGHEFIKENTYLSKGGSRFCRTCKRLRERNRPPRTKRVEAYV